MLAREAAQKIHAALSAHESSTIEFQQLESREIFAVDAFAYFTNALAAHLATAGIQRSSSDWKLHGVLSKQETHVVFSFQVLQQEKLVSAGSARIPDDTRLRRTLAQFPQRSEPHQDHHTGHKDMPVPTPLAHLKELPLDIAEHCPSRETCSLLLLYPDKLVQHNWSDGSDREVRIVSTGDHSRAPSGKILKSGGTLFVLTNQLTTPLAFNDNLESIKAVLPAQFPQPERGLNTYSLADGRFFDFEEVGSRGLAVINLQNRLAIADQKKLAVAEQVVGGALEVSLPYIYTSSPTLPDQYADSIQKFLYSDGLLRMEQSQTIDGSIYDITITDLNRDQKQEMLITVINRRGIFIEVREPF